MNIQPFAINRRDFIIGSSAALAVAPGFPLAASTQEATPESQVVHFDVSGRVHRFSVGEFDCLAISDGASINADPADLLNTYDLLFAATPREEAEAALDDAGYEIDQLVNHHTCVLVDTGDQVVLVDTGFGPQFGGQLLSNLAGEGINPEDIDVVVNTHGHGDHIGGNADADGDPTYPNARYVMSEEEWDFWTDLPRVEEAVPNAPFREALMSFVQTGMMPLADRFELIAYDVEIVPGVISIASQGHTPGHMAVLVQSEGEQLWIGGDMAIHPLNMPHPSFAGLADIDPELMEETRTRLFAQMAEEGGLSIFYHFDPFPSMGNVMADGDVWRWEPRSI